MRDYAARTIGLSCTGQHPTGAQLHVQCFGLLPPSQGISRKWNQSRWDYRRAAPALPNQAADSPSVESNQDYFCRRYAKPSTVLVDANSVIGPLVFHIECFSRKNLTKNSHETNFLDRVLNRAKRRASMHSTDCFPRRQQDVLPED